MNTMVLLSRKNKELTSWIPADPTSVPFMQDIHTFRENCIFQLPKIAPEISKNLYHIREQKLLQFQKFISHSLHYYDCLQEVRWLLTTVIKTMSFSGTVI